MPPQREQPSARSAESTGSALPRWALPDRALPDRVKQWRVLRPTRATADLGRKAVTVVAANPVVNPVVNPRAVQPETGLGITRIRSAHS